MKRLHTLLIAVLVACCVHAQHDQNPFQASLYNEQNEISMEIDLVKKNILVPQQEVLGEVAGYISIKKDFRKWIVIDAEMIRPNTAQLSVVNDYGSEDFVAVLTFNPDGSYTWKHQSGSPMKFVINKKWHKMSGTLSFKRQEPKKDIF